MSQPRPPKDDETELAPEARFTRETFLGCIGLGCILLTLPLLWLAVGVSTRWATHALPVLAFGAAVGGAALTMRVPGVVRSRDPERPLTRAGSAPALERPAQTANRSMWALTAALVLCALGGYGREIARSGETLDLWLMLGAGVALLTLGALVGAGRLPAPALRWVKLSIYSGAASQGAPLLAIGFVTTGGALFLAVLDGHMWGLLALALLIAAMVSLTPFVRRMPGRNPPSR